MRDGERLDGLALGRLDEREYVYADDGVGAPIEEAETVFARERERDERHLSGSWLAGSVIEDIAAPRRRKRGVGELGLLVEGEARRRRREESGPAADFRTDVRLFRHHVEEHAAAGLIDGEVLRGLRALADGVAPGVRRRRTGRLMSTEELHEAIPGLLPEDES